MIKKHYKILIFLGIYFLINLLFLDKYPFMHSDEAWLSNLSRNIAESNSFKVTETVFDLYPRFPHAIRILFQSVQIVFLKIFSYELFTFRLMSLISSCLLLFVFYKLAEHIYNERTALTLTILLSFNIQFIYASHFARQEIILVLIEVLSIYLLFKNKYLLSAIVLGLSVAIHPNAFIIALTVGSFYLYYLVTKKINIRTFLLIILVPTLFAVAVALLSLGFNPDFFSDYFSYGSTLSVDATLLDKIRGFDNFYSKLYRMISATYYTPDIRIYFALVALLLLYIVVRKRKSDNMAIVFSLIAINIGIIIIGRYNPTSIIFMFPLFYLLAGNINNRYVYFVILLITMFNSAYNIYPYLNNDYQDYIDNIAEYVEPDDKVLANLNTEYYFDNDCLKDYRNLYHLRENNISFSEYMKMNEIEYIIYSEEMDFIYQRRPVWNIIYGNTYYYYEDMKNFLENNCVLEGEFSDNTYAMRIVAYQDQEYSVKIYKIINY